MATKINPLAKLWVGKCTIYEYKDTTDPDNFQTTHGLVPVVVDEPCRLSQNFVSHNQTDITHVNNGAPYVDRLIVLFLRPDIEIKEGSVIEVTQCGVTDKYKRSGKPAMYSNHQEVVLKIYEETA